MTIYDWYDPDELWEETMSPAIKRLKEKMASRDRRYQKRYDMVVQNKSLKDVRINAVKRNPKGRALRRRRANAVSKNR